jgi:hypothetical protein
MTVIHTLVHNDNYHEYETTGEEFLQTLTVEQLTEALVVYVDPDEDYSKMSKKELIALLVKEDLWEIYGKDIEDFYYKDAEREYNEMQQAIADEKWERDRGRL